MNSAFTYNYELLMSLISELESEINSLSPDLVLIFPGNVRYLFRIRSFFF